MEHIKGRTRYLQIHSFTPQWGGFCGGRRLSSWRPHRHTGHLAGFLERSIWSFPSLALDFANGMCGISFKWCLLADWSLKGREHVFIPLIDVLPSWPRSGITPCETYRHVYVRNRCNDSSGERAKQIRRTDPGTLIRVQFRYHVSEDLLSCMGWDSGDPTSHYPSGNFSRTDITARASPGWEEIGSP